MRYITYALLYLIFISLLLGIGTLFTSGFSRTINLTKSNTVIFEKVVNKKSVTEAWNKIVKMRFERPAQIIYLVLDSPGGSVLEGYRLLSLLNAEKDVITVTIYAASMAASIVQYNEGLRLSTIKGHMMFHDVSVFLFGQYPLPVLKSIVEDIEKTNDILMSGIAKRIGISLKEMKSHLNPEWRVFGSGLIELNMVDEIVDIKCIDFNKPYCNK